MENAKSGKEKQMAYRQEYKRFTKALKEAFYLEAIAIGYAIIEDRFVSFLDHAGIVSRYNNDLRINRCVYPYMRRLLNKEDDYSIRIKDISVQMNVICKLLNMTASRAVEIDNEVEHYVKEKGKRRITRKGYMNDLYQQINCTIDRELIADILYDLEPWRDERNQLIHALLNKTISSSEIAKKRCAEKGYELSRHIDNCLVKAFKTNNTIKKKYNIQ